MILPIAASPPSDYNGAMTETIKAAPRPRLDPDRMALARAKARESRYFTLSSLLLSAVYFLAWWKWVHLPLITWLEANVTSTDLQVLIYFILFGAGMTLLELPVDAYRHTRSVHYGLSVQSWRVWFSDLIKGLAIGAILVLILVVILYRLLAAFPDTWWLWMGLIYLLVTVLLTQLAPILIMPLFFNFTPYEDDDLTPRLQALAEQAGTHVRGVYRTNLSEKTTAANAWLSGLGKTRRIVLGDTLLASYTHDEILAVFAHEMGHHVHRDLWRGILISSIVNLAGFWIAGQVLQWAVMTFGYAGPADLRAFPWLVLALAIFGAVTAPLLNAYTRSREWAADDYAIEFGPSPTAFADALTRLANQNLSDPEPPRWEIILTYSHPPTLQRIARANATPSDR